MLASTLACDSAAFWQGLADPVRACALGAAVDAYLSSARRPWDSGGSGSNDAATLTLHRRCLAVLTQAADAAERGAPPPPTRADALASSRLLSLPRLLDVAAVYMPTAPSAAAALITAAFDVVPSLEHDLETALPAALDALDAAVSDAGAAAGRRDVDGVATAIALLRDGAATLAAAAAARAATAEAVLAAEGGAVGGVLAAAHDELVPRVEAALRSSTGVDEVRMGRREGFVVPFFRATNPIRRRVLHRSARLSVALHRPNRGR